jgi:hypothetical protein
LFGCDLALLFLAVALAWSSDPGGTDAARFVLAGFAVFTGALLSIAAALRFGAPPALPKARPGKWFLTRSGTGEAMKDLIVHAQLPIFVGEIQRAPGGRIDVLPLAVEGMPVWSGLQSQRLAREAAEAYREIMERRGKQFRAALE